jgi:hypothetical protein
MRSHVAGSDGGGHGGKGRGDGNDERQARVVERLQWLGRGASGPLTTRFRGVYRCDEVVDVDAEGTDEGDMR